MNELAPINPAQHMTVTDVERVATAIAKGGLFGSKDPNAVLTLCLLAQAEGQHPAVVFRDYHIISGRPAKKADAMLRDFIQSGGKVEWHQLDDNCADATFRHPAGEARIEWTMERAQKAQLKTAMWNKYPRQMLRSRVISEGVRTVYPGATSGLYEEGEVRDMAAEAPPASSETSGEVIELTPEQDYEFPDGPATGITNLKDLVRGLWREVMGCGDEDQLIGLLEMPENKAIIEQASNLEHPAHREIYYGDGGDNPGLEGVIERQRRDLAQEAA